MCRILVTYAVEINEARSFSKKCRFKKYCAEYHNVNDIPCRLFTNHRFNPPSWTSVMRSLCFFVGHNDFAIINSAVEYILWNRLAEQISLQSSAAGPVQEFRLLAGFNTLRQGQHMNP